MELAFVITVLYDALLESFLGLILFSILIVLIWPKTGYQEANDLAGRVALLVMHAGIVIFKLAALFLFALVALLLLFAGFVLVIAALASMAGSRAKEDILSETTKPQLKWLADAVRSTPSPPQRARPQVL